MLFVCALSTFFLELRRDHEQSSKCQVEIMRDVIHFIFKLSLCVAFKNAFEKQLCGTLIHQKNRTIVMKKNE
jgi:hypothetical protein